MEFRSLRRSVITLVSPRCWLSRLCRGEDPVPSSSSAARLRRTRSFADSGAVFRVDFRRTNTDPHRGSEWPVHALVGADQGIVHFARVRDKAAMRARSRYHTHAASIDWDSFFSEWELAHRRPHWFCIRYSPRRGPLHFRTSQLPFNPATESALPAGTQNRRRTLANAPVLLAPSAGAVGVNS